MVRIHETIGFSDLEFGLRVRPIGEVASIEVFPDGFADDVEYDGTGLGFRKVIKKVGSKIKSIHKKMFKKLKKGFLKAAPILGIAAMALNFVVPGLGVAVGLAINLGAGAMKARAAKKEAKKAEKAEDAAAAAEAQELDAESDKASVEAYDKGEKYFTQKYGMTREKFMALTPKGRYDFLMGATYDVNVPKFTAKGVSREAFLAMSIDDQTLLLAQINAAAGVMSDEDAITAMLGGSKTLALVTIGVGAIAIILVVYLLTRK